MLTRYLIILSRPGYLPETDPYIMETDSDGIPKIEALDYIIGEIERAAPDYDLPDSEPWNDLLDKLDGLRDRPSEVDSDLRIACPDGYVWEARRIRPTELIDLGFAPDLDAYGDRSEVIDIEGSPLDFDHPDWCPDPDEIAETITAINFHAAYGHRGH